MRNVTKAMLATLCGGVLVCGIGCGVAFAEITSLEYAGVRSYGMENAQKTTEKVQVAESDGRVLIDDLETYGFSSWSFAFDASLPSNTIEVDFCYDPSHSDCVVESFEPRYYEGHYTGIDPDGYAEVLRFTTYSYRSQAYEMVEVIDPFLADLRNGEFADYRFEGATAEIRASADLEGRLDFLSTACWDEGR